MIAWTENDGEMMYTVQDHLGSPMLTVDGKGNVTAKHSFTAFGASTTDNPVAFNGKLLDEETGLVYYGFRFFDTDMGRWLTPDPLGYTDGPNIYAYCGNDPVNYVDPLGLAGVDVHFYLELFLAQNAGFTPKEAMLIALSNQELDDNNETGPMPWQKGWWLLSLEIHLPKNPELIQLWKNTAYATKSPEWLGKYDHIYIDSITQSGLRYKNDLLGHGPNTASYMVITSLKLNQFFNLDISENSYAIDPDKSWLNPVGYYKAARDTYYNMLKFQKSRGVKVHDNWPKIQGAVKSFIRHKTLDEKLKDLEMEKPSFIQKQSFFDKIQFLF